MTTALSTYRVPYLAKQVFLRYHRHLNLSDKLILWKEIQNTKHKTQNAKRKTPRGSGIVKLIEFSRSMTLTRTEDATKASSIEAIKRKRHPFRAPFTSRTPSLLSGFSLSGFASLILGR